MIEILRGRGEELNRLLSSKQLELVRLPDALVSRGPIQSRLSPSLHDLIHVSITSMTNYYYLVLELGVRTRD